MCWETGECKKGLRKDIEAINCSGQDAGGVDQGQGLGHAEFEMSVTYLSR